MQTISINSTPVPPWHTTCACFDFPVKLRMRTYLAGKTKINWKKNTWKVVNRLNWVLPLVQVYTPVSYLWILGKICETVAQHSDVQIEGQLFLYYFIVYHQWNDILSEEWNGSLLCGAMGREKWPANKINNARICSAHFATDKPS